MSPWRSERGAAAVEFALVVPILLAILMGTIEFGRAYNAQISLTHAARETARSMAVNDDGVDSAETWEDAVGSGIAAAPSVNLTSTHFTAVPASCASAAMIEVTVSYPLDTITGIADDMVLEGKAAMRCGG
jgi:Flp pilus assembly protein TadG